MTVSPTGPSLPTWGRPLPRASLQLHHEISEKVGGHPVGHGRLALSVSPLSSPLLMPQLDIVEFIPSLLYFGYTALMVLSFWLLTGTIGFYAAYMFVRKIYAAVKID